MPLGNLFGLTNHYLSWSLYSGHVPTAYVTADQALLQSLALKAPVIPDNTGKATLSFVYFSMYTLNAVPYPETWVFRAIFDDLCTTYHDHELTLNITTRPFFNSRQTNMEYYSCNE
jgi:hypothetical protein